jgi:hypothetical protein
LSDNDRLGQERALKCKYGLTGGATPAAPAGLTPVAGNHQISLNWLLAAGATSYDLWRSTNNGASYQLAAALTTSSYVDANAANGQTNYYKIASVDACGPGAFSPVAAVVLPLPVLNLILNLNAMTLHWPGWASDWNLLATTNLTPPVAWSPVTNAIGSSNGQFNVSLPLNSPTRFFRLHAP